MKRNTKRSLALGITFLAVASTTAVTQAQVTQEEVDGVIYQVTRQTVPRVVNETRYESRKVTTYRDRYTTDMQEVNRTYQVPVTEQQWVPGYQKTWNVFAPPVLSYRLMPVTRWETRNETVRVPVTKREVVPEELVQQVPVTSQRVIQEEYVRKQFVSLKPGTALANSSGGTKLNSDPPRSASGWQASESPSSGTSWLPSDRSAR